jgi:hypothetical protein
LSSLSQSLSNTAAGEGRAGEGEEIHRVVTPSTIEVPPPPPVEKELGVSPSQSRGGSDDGDDGDDGETVEIGQNTKFCPNLEPTMNGPKSEQSEIKQNSAYHQVRRFELR